VRESIIDLTRSLPKGLRAFDDKSRGDLMLDECFNFQTTESGLAEYSPLQAIGWQTAYFNYLSIRDQNGGLWYWYPVFDGHILVGTSVPTEPTTGLEAMPLVATPIEWVEILDENNEVWKLYPDASTGETRATDFTPLSGVGLANLVWRGTTSESWMLRFSNAELARYAVRVG
jgi:hypothetical protein